MHQATTNCGGAFGCRETKNRDILLLPRSHRTTQSRAQREVDDVVDIMRKNVGKVLERGERIEDIEDKSGEPGRESAVV